MNKAKSMGVKPYSLSELAGLYRISTQTMKKWISPHEVAIGNKIGRFYNIKQVQKIFEALGVPPELDCLDE
jgi:uncharacterized protein YjcR